MVLQYLNKNIHTNVKFSYHKTDRFFKNWHYHSELELVYIIQGQGIFHVGDFKGTYMEDDIILLGQNLPHMFSEGKLGNQKLKHKAYVFHIHKNFLTNIFSNYSEFNYLEDILNLSARGAIFRHRTNKECIPLLDGLNNAPDTLAVLQLFQLLFRLSNYHTPKQLCNVKWEDVVTGKEKRISSVIEYISKNFNDSLSLENAAEISGMNKAAFCRHFKKKTGKSFVEFLNETRVNYARRLLLDASADYRISEICYQSGFNSLSYFNRIFKKYTGYGPRAYKIEKNRTLAE